MANYRGYLKDKNANQLNVNTQPYEVFYAEAVSMTITPEKSGILDISFYWNGWSYGGTVALVDLVCTSGGATPLITQPCGIQGQDTILRQLSIRGLFQVTGGVTYTFTRSFLSGGNGSTQQPKGIAILYRN